MLKPSWGRSLVVCGLPLMYLASGCGGESVENAGVEGEEFEEAGLDWATLDEALSTNEECATLTAHRTTTGAPGTFTTTSNYDPAGCHDGYLIDAVDYVGRTNHPVFPNMFFAHMFEHADADAATTQAACEKQRVAVYAWRNSSGTLTYLGNHWQWGQWVSAGASSFCRTQISPYWQFGIGFTQTTRDYRFALSARTYVTAGNGDSAYTRKAIKSASLTFVQ